MNSVYDAYFPDLATPGYFIIVAYFQARKDVQAYVYIVKEIFRSRDEERPKRERERERKGPR